MQLRLLRAAIERSNYLLWREADFFNTLLNPNFTEVT